MNKKRLDKLTEAEVDDMFKRISHVYSDIAELLLAELGTVSFAAGLEKNSKKETDLYILLNERPINFNKVTNFYYKTMMDLYHYKNARKQNPQPKRAKKMPNASGNTKALKSPDIRKLPKTPGPKNPS